MWAAMGGHVSAVALMLGRGADLEARDAVRIEAGVMANALNPRALHRVQLGGAVSQRQDLSPLGNNQLWRSLLFQRAREVCLAYAQTRRVAALRSFSHPARAMRALWANCCGETPILMPKTTSVSAASQAWTWTFCVATPARCGWLGWLGARSLRHDERGTAICSIARCHLVVD